MLCHGELVLRRPGSEHLTAFYLAMSFGGVMGGVFNALVAPCLFDRVAEYPLALVLACLVLPGMHRNHGALGPGFWTSLSPLPWASLRGG